jgi:hypothetical protein
MKYVAVAFLWLSVSACSENTQQQNASPQIPDAPLEIVITQFPQAYIGRWGMTANDCVLHASDAKGLMSVQGSLVKFYESIGTMRNGKRQTVNSLTSDFDMVGEGQKWQTRNTFQLIDERNGLTRIDTASGDRFVYTRCHG